MKKFLQLTYILIGLQVLDDGTIFSCLVCFQERVGLLCKHRRTEETKTKVNIFVYKIFTKIFLKATNHWDLTLYRGKVKPL